MTKWTWNDLIDYFQYKETKLDKSQTSRFRSRAYQNVINKIRQKKDLLHIIECDDINTMDLTKYMKELICDILKKPHKKNKMGVFTDLVNLPGIGPTLANRLIEDGLKNIADIQQKKWFSKLPEETKVHLIHTPEKRIPHQHMVYLEPLLMSFEDTAESHIPNVKVGSIACASAPLAPVSLRETCATSCFAGSIYDASTERNIFMVGSYRRDAEYSSDFDIMLCSSDEHILDKYLKFLEKHFDVWVYSKGPNKMSLIVYIKKQLPEPHTYKFDIFRCEPTEKYSMLLYATGSKEFNIKMRARAKRMGYLLNQNGLFDNGKRIPIHSEREYFDILGIDWVPPERR